MRKALWLPGLLLVFFTISLPVIAETAAPSGQQTSDETAIELTFWNTVKHTKDPAILQTYLDRYPNGAFAGLARVMMERLVKGQETKQPAPTPTIAPPPQPDVPRAGSEAAAEPAPEAKLLKLRAR
jgi:hypothetical protein